jgi:hypothetical protein
MTKIRIKDKRQNTHDTDIKKKRGRWGDGVMGYWQKNI